MTNTLISLLAILVGLLAAGVGIVAARGRLRRARRAFRRTALLCETMPTGWGSWFFSGFSVVTIAARWFWAVVTLAIWTLIGAGFIYLGVHL